MDCKVSGVTHDNQGNRNIAESIMEPTLIPVLETDSARTAVDEIVEAAAFTDKSDVELLLSQRFDVPDEIIKKLMAS